MAGGGMFSVVWHVCLSLEMLAVEICKLVMYTYNNKTNPLLNTCCCVHVTYANSTVAYKLCVIYVREDNDFNV